MHRKEY